MSTLKDQITDLQNELLVAKDEGKITPEGAKLLGQIQSGQWQTGGFGQFLKGMTANFSDEGIGAIKSFISSDPKNISEAMKRSVHKSHNQLQEKLALLLRELLNQNTHKKIHLNLLPIKLVAQCCHHL